MNKRALIVVAHADDAELSMGGTLNELIKKDYQIKIVHTTLSDYTDYNNKTLRTRAQAIDESSTALNSFGITDSQFLNFRTKRLQYNNETVEAINKIIDTFEPTIIFTHHVEDRHQDHCNTAKSVIGAARYHDNVLMFEPVYPSNTHLGFQPQIYIDMSTSMQNKLYALSLHKTQFQKYDHWNELVISLARTRGIEIGVKYAEAFMPLKMRLSL
jgi:LmbE family N-acetylglucosaminyl deacetylase